MPPSPYKTPGVYIEELNAFPNSVVEVATAIPAFIGFTERAAHHGQSLTNVPTRIDSLKQFEDYFGRGSQPVLQLTETPATAPAAGPRPLVAAPVLTLGADAAKSYSLLPAGGEALYYLYPSIRLFYLNGGATCYIVSVGDYRTRLGKQLFLDAIDTLEPEQDPTLLLCPDALRLSPADYHEVLAALLAHCASVQSRMALLDVHGGAGSPTEAVAGLVADFREGVGVNFLNYGAAYFPWVHTSVVSLPDVSFAHLSADSLLLLKALFHPPQTARLFDQALALLADAPPGDDQAQRALADQRQVVHHALLAACPGYKLVLAAIADYLNTLPVAPALAGVYTATDSSRGVWKAPANVSLNAVVAPTVSLSDREQADLNVDAATGKSINVIRAFKGLGTLVWGARTLDGNSQDWRYVNVRRTMILIEQSIKLATRAYVFEPNDANTWVTVQSMLNNFLFNLWKQGALAGAAPNDAYQVLVGLGSTMTAQDILDGYLNVTVLVAISRPAEFIELTFQQQMQKS